MSTTTIRIIRALLFACFVAVIGMNLSWWGQALAPDDLYLVGAVTTGVLIIVSQFGRLYVDRP